MSSDSNALHSVLLAEIHCRSRPRFQNINPDSDGAHIKGPRDLKNEIQIITLPSDLWASWKTFLNKHSEGELIDPDTDKMFKEDRKVQAEAADAQEGVLQALRGTSPTGDLWSTCATSDWRNSRADNTVPTRYPWRARDT